MTKNLLIFPFYSGPQYLFLIFFYNKQLLDYFVHTFVTRIRDPPNETGEKIWKPDAAWSGFGSETLVKTGLGDEGEGREGKVELEIQKSMMNYPQTAVLDWRGHLPGDGGEGRLHLRVPEHQLNGPGYKGDMDR